MWETADQQHLAFWKEATCLPVLVLWTSCSAPVITVVLHPDVFFEDLFRNLEQKSLTPSGLFFPNKFLLSASRPAVSKCCISKEFCIDMYLSSSPSSLNISYFWKKEQDWIASHQNLSSCSPSFPLLPRLCMPLSNCCHPPHLPNISINNVNTLLLGQALSLTGALLCIFPVRYVYTEDLCPGRHAEFV